MTDPSQLQNAAIRQDYRTLQQRTDATIDAPNRLLVHHVDYPDGWTPGTADVLLRYPDTYPHDQPAIYIPQAMSYSGRVTHRLNAPAHLAADWVRWCTHYIDWARWRAYCRRTESSPILTFLGLIRDSLAHPADSNPIKHASRR